MADRILISIGTKKGVFVAEGAKTRRKFELRGPFGPGVTSAPSSCPLQNPRPSPVNSTARVAWSASASAIAEISRSSIAISSAQPNC